MNNEYNGMNHELEKQLGRDGMQQLKENQRRFFWLGVSLIILGTLAVIFSTVSTLVSVIYLGAFLVMLGFFEGAKAFNMRLWKGYFLLHIVMSILFMVAGIFMIMNPLENAVMLTLFWSIFFVIAGIVRIVTAITHHVPHQGLVIFNGAINILLGALVFWQWPASGLWVIGLFVGIDVLLAGWSLIMVSSMAKNIHLKAH